MQHLNVISRIICFYYYYYFAIPLYSYPDVYWIFQVPGNCNLLFYLFLYMIYYIYIFIYNYIYIYMFIYIYIYINIYIYIYSIYWFIYIHLFKLIVPSAWYFYPLGMLQRYLMEPLFILEISFWCRFDVKSKDKSKLKI